MGLTGAMDMFVVILSTKCNQLYTPKPNCELFRKSFMYSGAVIWNSLLRHVKNATFGF